MARRYETTYRSKAGDNYGDPEFWNRRFEDLDRRVDGNETALESVDSVADRIESVALQRLDTLITPLVVETRDRVATLANLFSASSKSSLTIAATRQFVVIDEGQRSTFAHLGYVSIIPEGHLSAGMLGAVESYDSGSGALVVVVDFVWGDGTFTAWNLHPAQPADAHAVRTDNPHETTAAQVGAYTQAQVDQIVAQAVASVRGTATAAGDTLGELEATVAANALAATEEAVAMAIALG